MSARTPDLIVFEGGPLDGQTITSTAPRAAIYRGDDGRSIPAAAGDREFLPGRPPRFYRHDRERYDEAAGRFEHVYVHATAKDDSEGG